MSLTWTGDLTSTMIPAGMRAPAASPNRFSDQPRFYRIRVEGVLDERWCGWFEGFSLRPEDGQTVLSGWVTDLPALYGLLTRICDLGLPLISVERQ